MQQSTYQAQTNKIDLQEFARDCVAGVTLKNFRKYAFAKYPDYALKPFNLLLPFKELMKGYVARYPELTSVFNSYEHKNVELFKEYANSENAGPFTFMQALFFPAILILGNEKQIEYWTKLCLDHRITVSYAQTEIAHGSDVQGIQTVAEYNPQKKCLVFNTPSIGAMKFWPGGLGCVCTHIVTQAQLIVNGKKCGLQTFVVQIRDFKDMKLVKGVEAGDIGPKFGFKSIDNGYLKFTNFEAPVDALLQKFIQLDADGNLTQNEDKNAQTLTYGAMMNLRSNLLRLFTGMNSKLYGMAYLHQKKLGFNSVEARTWLDGLAVYWDFILASLYIRNVFTEFMKHYNTDVKQALRMIKEMHFLTSGMKVLSSWNVVKLAREQAVGNYLGNLTLNGLLFMYGEALPTVTYEGDNIVLIQQVAQILLLYYNNLRTGKEIKGSATQFLNKYQKYVTEDLEFTEKIVIKKPEDFFTHSQQILENFCFKYLSDFIKKFQKALMEDGIPMKVAMADTLQIPLVTLGIAFYQVVFFKMASSIFHSHETKNLKDEDYKILSQLVRLHEINIIKNLMNLLVEYQIVELDDNLMENLNKAKESVAGPLVKHVDYICSQMITSEYDLTTVDNYKDITHPNFVNLNDSMQKIAKTIQGNINRLSKL